MNHVCARYARLAKVTVCVGLVLSPGRLYAQAALLDQMSALFRDKLVLAQTPGGLGIVRHTPVFDTDPNVVQVTSLIREVSSDIGSQISTFPFGSSSGGFTFRYDPSVGIPVRTTATFGPAFAERGYTIGKGRYSVGMNYAHASYDSLEGKDLENGDIKFYLLHQALTPPSYVQGDVVQAALAMKMSSDTTAFYATFGATDRLDVGIAVPLVHVRMDLTYRATILDFATHASAPTTHVFANGGKTVDVSSSGSASGIGDVLLRAKYGLLASSPVRLAAGLDLRLPSGDSKNMLGSGSTQGELFAIVSGGAVQKIVPHLNLGYTFTGGSGLANDQINYVGGVEIAASPRVTVVGDIVGRTLRNALRLSDVSLVHRFQQGSLTAPVETVTLQSVQTVTGNLASAFGAAGIKMNPWSAFLISAHLLVPLTNTGLHSRVAAVVGFEYAF